MAEFFVVQHAQKASAPGDPPLSALGVEQARLTALFLRGRAVARLVSSPARRARETARPIADELGLPLHLDDRLRERMDWGAGPDAQPLDDFLREWARATRERDYRPRGGDSSRAAGDRFLALLEELARGGEPGPTVLVTHGGVTVDLARNLFPDASLQRLRPGIIESGVMGCAITHLVRGAAGYELRALGAVDHLPAALRSGHAPAPHP